ncbi:metal-dependent hydrolase [Mycolicibacterium aurum]|uniref:Metal-dependent hydrolase n=1 Tax=Mycolicibacterium aurum TaxID=1791 RepID=A0A3S4RT80_MYCAU|nr:endonuclease/exonuclease/phosphatase family protein [Mycolicibacterium aurum]VEG51862.1 metal-dependent hydrolase [Mycolicibacterium aurum]
MTLLRRRRIVVPVGRFDASADRWRDSTRSGSVECAHLTVTTYNIWFNDLYRQQRYRAIAALLSRELPDVMVFQEVTEAALEVFLAQSWIRKHYSRVAVTGEGNYGMLLLSRLPIRRSTYTRLPTRLGRGYLTAEFTINGVDQKIVSVHLESGKQGKGLRARQLSCLFRAFRTDPDVLLLGDFNMRDNENHLLDPRYQDVWPTLRPDESGFTEDTSINLMRYDMKNKHRHVRFDRVLVKGPAWRADGIGLLGCEPITPSLPRIFPSDHFGVLCRLTAQPVSGAPAGRTGWRRRVISR